MFVFVGFAVLLLDRHGSLRYTNDEGRRLTKNQRVLYEKNGYLVVPRLVPLDVLRRCSERETFSLEPGTKVEGLRLPRDPKKWPNCEFFFPGKRLVKKNRIFIIQRFDDIVSGKAPRDGMIVMHDVTDRSLVNKIQDLNHDDVFREYFEYKPLLDIVESFTGPSIIAMHSMLIAKPPDAGSKSSRHPPHQDLYYFPFRPADRIVATWTAIEPCDTLNGCLYVSPGSHLPGHLFPHGYPNESTSGPVNKLYHQIQDLPDSMGWVDLEFQPGDTLFFHPLLVHGSGINRSQRTRKAISCHYAATDCQYTEIRGTVQEPIRSEVMEIVSKRYPGLKIDYEDLWRAKAKLVRGVRSSL